MTIFLSIFEVSVNIEKRVRLKSHSPKLMIFLSSIMTKNSQNGHNGRKQGFSQVSYYLGVGLTVTSIIVTLGTLLLFSNLLSEEILKLLLWQSIYIADVGQHLVEKESEKRNRLR